MHATLLVSYSHAWVFGTMPFFVCRWHNFMIIIRCMMWLFGAYQLNQRRHWTILPINFRTARCSFRIGPIMIVDEPFTVSIHSYLYSRSYLACELDIIFCSDWQRTDDTHHENKTGQSDRKIPNRDRSVVQVRYGVLVRVSADSNCDKKLRGYIENDASIWCCIW